MKHTADTDGPNIELWALPADATTRLGRGRIRGGLTFSPDGDSLVVATDIGCWLYDLDTLTPSALWATERGMVSAISFSHNGKWIAIGNMHGTVKVCDTQTLQSIAIIETNRLVTRINISPSGQHLAIATVAGGVQTTIYACRPHISTPIANFALTLEQRVKCTTSIAFSPNGCLFAYTSDINKTSVIYVETGEIIAELHDTYTTYTEEPGGCTKLVFSPCGKFLAGCNKKDTVHVWDIQSGNFAIEPTTYHQSTRVLPTYLSDGTLKVAASYRKEVIFWNTKLQQKMDAFEYIGSEVGATCFSVDGRKFAIASKYDDLKVWCEGSPSKVVSLPEHLHPDPVQRFPNILEFSKDSRTLFCGYWKHTGYLAWDVSKRQIARTFPSHSRGYSAHPEMPFTMSHNAELIATANGTDSPISVWNVVSNTQVAEFLKSSRQVCWLTLSPKGEYLVGSMKGDAAKVWDVESGTQITELTEKDTSVTKGVRMKMFSPTGEYILGIGKDRISVWDALKWEHLYQTRLKEFNRSRRDGVFKLGTPLRFHPDGQHFFTAGYEVGAYVWELKNGEQVGTLPTEICIDTTLYRGDPQNIQLVRKQQETTRRVRQLEVSLCGTIIAGAMQNEIRVWDAATLQTKMVIIPPAGCQKPFTLAFSPCSQYLAAGVWWQHGQIRMSIRVWNITTGENITTFWAHPTDIDRLRFSPDGKYLASGSYDGTILLWDMEPYL